MRETRREKSPLPAMAGTLLAVVTLATAQAALPSVDLSAANPGEGFSPVKSDGGVRCRHVRAGRMRLLPIKVWWLDNSLRPPENTVYAFEVRYKDVVSSPVIAYSYGGLGRYHEPQEVHRFGGKGDGRWKTAVVCAGWDQLMRRTGDKATTAIGFRAAADLPVASVKVRLAAHADQARHNAETRAWVAAVQAAKRRAVPLNVEPLRGRRARTRGPVVAFAWSTLVPLLPNAQPKAEVLDEPIKIRMCLNELEGGAFGVFANGKALTNVEYRVSELTGPGGRLVADVIPRTAEYALVRRGRQLKWWPQRLWPAFKTDIAANHSHWFLFNLRTRRGKTAPGTYKGKVTVTCDQGRSSLPVQVEVLPVDLLTMNEAGLFMGGCVTGLVPAHDIEFAVDYNQNGINLWFSGVQPAASIRNDKLHLDFTILDEWMAAARKRGLVGNVWFLGGNPYGFPRTMTIFRTMGTIDTRNGNRPPSMRAWIKKQASEKYRDKPMKRDRELAVEWVRQVAAHAREKDWPEVILTPFDEPAKWVQGPFRSDKQTPETLGTGPWIKSYFKDGCAVIREGAPGLRIYGSIHHISRRGRNEGPVFIPDIDVFCTNAIHEDATIGDRVRSAGKTFWQYSGGTVPDQARFGYGFYFAAFGSVGSLRWAYNWGRGFDTTEGANWMYAWHTPFDTIPAPSFEGMREAWDDRRVIATCRKAFAKDPAAMAVLKRILKEAAASRARGGRDTVSDFWTAIDDVGKMDRWRSALLARLVKAQGRPRSRTP